MTKNERVSPRPPEAERARSRPVDDPDRAQLAEPAATVPGRTTDDSVVKCPWCGAQQELFLEPPSDMPDQTYMEECRECGRSFRVDITWGDAGAPSIQTGREGQG